MDINQLTLNDFDYDLPEDRIAPHPLKQREQSKLLVYQTGKITHKNFYDLPNSLPKKSLLVFNDTRVIPARILVYKETGARIEVFLLSPQSPSEIEQAMQVKESIVWECMIGNKKRWRDGEVLTVKLPNDLTVFLTFEDREANHIKITWDQPVIFADLLEMWGKMPLPPYIKRDVIDDDKTRYQTVYANHNGAVAAPTAGLHFTDALITDLNERGIDHDFVTLHVGAGTFKPVTVEKIIHHDMHGEPFQVSRSFLEKLVQHEGPIIPVGTTAMRTLESLYWLGIQAINGLYDQEAPFVSKLEPYQQKGAWEVKDVLTALLNVIGDKVIGQTEIMIMPSYKFKLCDGLITNFHMPKSTLLMLIAAFTGGGMHWKEIYQAAMDNDYRFLSYGDSSLLLP